MKGIVEDVMALRVWSIKDALSGCFYSVWRKLIIEMLT